MSKLSEALRAKDIFNDHNLLVRFGKHGQNVGISYSPTDNSRGGTYAHTSVYRPGFKTDPNAHWQDHGCKTFNDKAAVSIPQAIAWATERYKIDKWVPSPFDRNDKIPEYVLIAAKKFLKED